MFYYVYDSLLPVSFSYAFVFYAGLSGVRVAAATRVHITQAAVFLEQASVRNVFWAVVAVRLATDLASPVTGGSSSWDCVEPISSRDRKRK